MTDHPVARQFAAATASVREAAPPEPRNRPPLSDEARQAIIEQARAMKDVRRYAAENREAIEADWNALTEPPRTIEAHLAGIDPERWQQLQAEWE